MEIFVHYLLASDVEPGHDWVGSCHLPGGHNKVRKNGEVGKKSEGEEKQIERWEGEAFAAYWIIPRFLILLI